MCWQVNIASELLPFEDSMLNETAEIRYKASMGIIINISGLLAIPNIISSLVKGFYFIRRLDIKGKLL